MQDTKNISWLYLKTSLFCCATDNYGKQRTFHQILFSDFGCIHPWYYKDTAKNQWDSGTSIDLQTVIDIRSGAATKDEIPLLKQTLQCYTPSASFECKKRGQEKIINTLPILQLDFDHVQDIENTKQKIFKLPCVGYVGKSVSGNGLFALILIDEPDKLKEYAEHLFRVFSYYKLKPDTSKGRNYTDLRFVSYDANALYRHDPFPLKIEKFHALPESKSNPITTELPDDRLLQWAITQVRQAEPGNRFEAVRRVAYCMGGYGFGLDEIKQAINNSSQYTGIERKYLDHADDAFNAGKEKPILING